VYSINLDNYAKILTHELYLHVLTNSLKIALIVTAFSIPLGYLLAYYAVFVASGARRHLLYFLIVTPIFTSFLLRVYVWKLILGRTGVINNTLVYIGVLNEPLSILLYNQASVCITLTYIFIPFVFLPVYSVLEKIDRSYIEASYDLGASLRTTFRKIILPLSMPGVLAGATFTFCISFGDFVVSALIGGTTGVMVSNLIIGQFGAAFNWPLGSALAVAVLTIVLVVIGIGSVAERRQIEQVTG
jgi:spermidine/putrescine transport system permease protein